MQDIGAKPESGRAPLRPVTIIGSRRGISTWAQEFWQYRGVLRALAARDLRGKYKQAVLGVSWAILQPLVLTSVFTFVFRDVAAIRTPVPYPVFVLASLLVFQLLQQVISLGSPAFVSARGIVTRVYFPRIYTVIAGGVSAYVNAVVTAVLLVGAMVWYGVTPGEPTGLLLALGCLAATAALALGTAALMAAVNARFRDVQHALPFLLTALLFVSPVLYPLDAAKESDLSWLLEWNPVTGLVGGFRSGLLGIPGPENVVIGASCGAAIVVFLLGLWFFERSEAELVDVL